MAIATTPETWEQLIDRFNEIRRQGQPQQSVTQTGTNLTMGAELGSWTSAMVPENLIQAYHHNLSISSFEGSDPYPTNITDPEAKALYLRALNDPESFVGQSFTYRHSSDQVLFTCISVHQSAPLIVNLRVFREDSSQDNVQAYRIDDFTYVPDAVAFRQKRSKEQELELYSFFEKTNERFRKTITRKINAASVAVGKQKQLLLRKERDIEQLKAMKAATPESKLTPDDITARIAEIKKHRKVQDAYINDSGSIIVLTKPLKVISQKTRKETRIPLGRFIFRFGMNSGYMLLYAQNRDYIAYGKGHPNISGSHICLGEEKENFYNLLDQAQFYALVESLIYFLQLFPHDGGDPYVNHLDWLEKKIRNTTDDNSLLTIGYPDNIRDQRYDYDEPDGEDVDNEYTNANGLSYRNVSRAVEEIRNSA